LQCILCLFGGSQDRLPERSGHRKKLVGRPRVHDIVEALEKVQHARMDVQCRERFYVDFGHALSFGSEAVELPKGNRHTQEHQKHYECV
jgi:hypothetical protein